MTNEVLFVVYLAFALCLPMVAYKIGKSALFVFVAINACILLPLAPLSADIFGYAVSISTIYYATLFLTTDLLTEQYGRKAAYYAVAVNIITSYLIVILMHFPLAFSPTEGSVDYFKTIGDAYAHTWRMTMLGTLCFALTQVIDIGVFHYLHKKTGEKFLWLRNNVSSLTSGLFANLFFWYFAFGHILDDWFATAMAGFVLTALVNLCDTPFMYLSKIKWMKPLEIGDRNHA